MRMVVKKKGMVEVEVSVPLPGWDDASYPSDSAIGPQQP